MNDPLFLAAECDQFLNREVPHSVEAEQAILGGLLIDPRAWARVSDLVVESDFFRADHRLIFKVIGRLLEEGRGLDVVTVQEALDRVGELSNAGGLAYLKELSDNTPSVANIASFARVVSERSQLRKIIGVCEEIEQSASAPAGRSAEDLVHEAEAKMLSVAGQRPKEGGPVGIEALLRNAVERIETAHESGLKSLGLSTGFVDLDSKLSLLRPADLVIVAGRPSMGKTSFAMNIVEEAVLRSEKVVVVYSLEMPGDALLTRMLSSMGGIDQSRVRSGKLLNEDWTKLTKAANALSKNKRFFIDDTQALSPSEMRSRTRRLRRVHGEIGLIMVDYLQLMQIPGYGGLNRTNEISAISRSLKALAKEFNCPVIALSQLNRSVEQRKDKRPVNSDLRESGAIEQDADVIMFVYRDEVYNPDSRFAGTAEIIIGKQREGPTGFVRLGFEGRFTRFVNLMPGAHDFTDQEMGVVMIDPRPRLGRMPVQQLAEGASKKVEGKGRGRRRKGARKPP